MDETAVAATFAYRHEAELARATLGAAGIEAVVLVDDAGGAYAGLALTGSARIVVRRDDVERARAVLGDASGHPPAGG